MSRKSLHDSQGEKATCTRAVALRTAPPWRAFIIGLDGAAGRGVRDAATPNIDAVMAGGARTYSARTVYPSASFQAWGAMFHGVGPEKHNLGGNTPITEDAAWPSFMKIARQVRPETKCASFSCWEPINSKIIEPSCNCHCVSMGDPELVAAAVEYIPANKPDIFFMQLDFIDHAGHRDGYMTEEYLKQISATDVLVGKVIDAIRKAGLYDDSLIAILSDHGGVDHTHGTDHDDCMTVFWSCRGPGIASGRELDSDVNIMDTAAVVAQCLGLKKPAGWDAKIPAGVFAR